MLDVRNYIEDDQSLLDCTNQRLRRAYARRIAKEFSEKLDVSVLIGDVEVIAEEIYKKNKK